MVKYEKKAYKKNKIKINKLYFVNSWENVRGNDTETITIVSTKFPGMHKVSHDSKAQPFGNFP